MAAKRSATRSRIGRWFGRSSSKAAELSPAEGYRRWAATYGQQPNALQQLEADALEDLLPTLDGRVLLDVGCGKARVAARALELGAVRALASDFAIAMLASPEAHREAGLSRLAAHAGQLPLRSESVDVVTCALVLGHLEKLTEPLAEMARVLRPGGSLVLTDFHPFATLRGWERTFNDPGDGRTYAIAQYLHLFSEYVQELGAHGLRIEAVTEPLWEGQPVVLGLRARQAS